MLALDLSFVANCCMVAGAIAICRRSRSLPALCMLISAAIQAVLSGITQWLLVSDGWRRSLMMSMDLAQISTLFQLAFGLGFLVFALRNAGVSQVTLGERKH
jgi:hypothetical protein